MKSILLSIKPKHAELIARGEKTIEVRETAPKEVPFKAYIYCTSSNVHDCILIDKSGLVLTYATNNKTAIVDSGYCGNGKIIGEFICDKITKYRYTKPWLYNGKRIYHLPIDTINTCLSYEEIEQYLGNKDGYGLHITALKIYDKPKELNEFYRPCSYSGICYSCNRFRPNGTPNDKPNDFCDGEITRPPQSWQYVEELEK